MISTLFPAFMICFVFESDVFETMAVFFITIAYVLLLRSLFIWENKINRIVKTLTVRKRLKIPFCRFFKNKKSKIQLIHTKIQVKISHVLKLKKRAIEFNHSIKKSLGIDSISRMRLFAKLRLTSVCESF